MENNPEPSVKLRLKGGELVALEEKGSLLDVDPNQPLFRIFPLRRFQEALCGKALALVPPSKWEDPFEQLPERSLVTDERDPGTQIPIARFLKPAFGQCWSKAPESDALWKAYSRVKLDPSGRNMHRDEEGVQVRSTAGKLMASLMAWAPAKVPKSCFIGSVHYGTGEQIRNQIGKLARNGCEVFSESGTRARLLLLKRKAFQHEEEVRLIYVAHDGGPGQDVQMVPINTSAVFESITFDPRLQTFELKEREAEFVKLGYQGPIERSELYRPRLLDIICRGIPAP